MSSLTIHPADGSQPFVAWRDGVPAPAALRAGAQLVGQRLGLTPEGPSFEAGWATIEQAAVLLRDIYPAAGIEGDPNLEPLMERPEGTV